jgi:hypothetical protein
LYAAKHVIARFEEDLFFPVLVSQHLVTGLDSSNEVFCATSVSYRMKELGIGIAI